MVGTYEMYNNWRREDRMRLGAVNGEKVRRRRCVTVLSLTARFGALVPACIRQRIRASASGYCYIHERLS